MIYKVLSFKFLIIKVKITEIHNDKLNKDIVDGFKKIAKGKL